MEARNLPKIACRKDSSTILLDGIKIVIYIEISRVCSLISDIRRQNIFRALRCILLKAKGLY
ncbi:hypothetical protein BGZ60DRAFT_160420 [Tricladium varicosporioides]|nr:hypothetical protein BGZ60DRAFT_160420 [Hymenoscyphus varicosporioides]